ncbi:hypothetical protein ACS15_2131 [Ralstonia insidiosa]|uniref:Uncharacterized protein n=1 Tax=Ralstonia insidiosa TaxID=190721 RepID=A0AAC9BDB8_9RALS|nr:hypothetical protein ACS15_2131 [Ralstonia insidiosa]
MRRRIGAAVSVFSVGAAAAGSSRMVVSCGVFAQGMPRCASF